MSEKKLRFSILYEEIDKLSKDSGIPLDEEELQEYEEIRTLREIVLETQETPRFYFTST